jgi:hypothetical protein
MNALAYVSRGIACRVSSCLEAIPGTDLVCSLYDRKETDRA